MSVSSSAAIEAWYMDADDTADQRLPHRQTPNAECNAAELESLGRRVTLGRKRERERNETAAVEVQQHTMHVKILKYL